MLLSQIASFVNIATNNQLSSEQLVLIMDNIQKKAFETNLNAFLVYDEEVTLLTEIEFAASGYTGAVDADIDATVTGGTSGATGTLVSYNNTTRKWVISSAGTFQAGETVSATTTGTGTLNTSNFQHGWRGPYTAPTDCRKIWGLTYRQPGRFDYALCTQDFYSVNGIGYTGDYGAMWGSNRPFEGGRVDDFTNTFRFAYDPDVNETRPMYWVYWKEPPSITDLSDSTEFVVPEAYHMQFMQAVKVAAMAIVANEDFDDKIVEKYLGGWIDAMRAPYRDQKGYQNMTIGEPYIGGNNLI